MNTWHIVHCTGIIQAVYGGALREMADDKAKEIEAKVGLVAGVVTVTGAKPKIGAEYHPDLDPEELAAVQDYAKREGRDWKRKLNTAWMNAAEPGILQQLRNTRGPAWLADYKLPET